MSVVLSYVWALALIALLLVGLTVAVRLINRGRIVVSTDRRLIAVIESTALNQHSSVSILKVGDRYYLVGGGSAGVTHIADVPAEVVDPYIETQRKALGEQRDAVLRLLQRFRRE